MTNLSFLHQLYFNKKKLSLLSFTRFLEDMILYVTTRYRKKNELIKFK